ncbi:MAG: DUF2304 domain-containing protein [Bacteroidales bacterium]|nr:DUF2304 domain-containing protein [Bacteroidales bacterium]MCM1414549.1 DUF2304 domain-containing protein [bacterium]MCM1422599.1 DUF2304 domain-containing protein [bacterium]
MIPATLRISLIVAIICYFIAILYFLKQKALNLKYTLLWLVAGLVMGLLVAIPELLVAVIHIFGIQNNMNGLFIFMIGFIILILLSLTSIASRQNSKIRTLTQELAILDKKVRELERNAMTADAAKDKEAGRQDRERRTDA